MSTLRKQHDEKVTNLEDRLQVALGKTLKILRSRARVNYNIKTMITTQELKSNIFFNIGAKLEHMMALREEVEQEYADRMEELRNMYRTEMESQNEKFTADKEKSKALESSLSDSLKLKREEADNYKSKATELETRVEDLARRLDGQTAEVIRLMGELENYEYGGGGGANGDDNEDEEDEDEESEYEEAE